MNIELAFTPPLGIRVSTGNSYVAWNESGTLRLWQPAETFSTEVVDGRFPCLAVNAFLLEDRFYVSSEKDTGAVSVVSGHSSSAVDDVRDGPYGARVVAPRELLLFSQWSVTLFHPNPSDRWTVNLDGVLGIYQDFGLDNFFVTDALKVGNLVYIAMTSHYGENGRLLSIREDGEYVGSTEIQLEPPAGVRYAPPLYLPVAGFDEKLICVDGFISYGQPPSRITPPARMTVAVIGGNDIKLSFVFPHAPGIDGGPSHPPPVAGVALSADAVLLATTSSILILRPDGTIDDYTNGIFPSPKFVSDGSSGLWLVCSDAVYRVEV